LANGIRIFLEHDNQYAIYASFYPNVLIDCTAAIAVIDNKPQPPAPMNSAPADPVGTAGDRSPVANALSASGIMDFVARLPCAPQSRVAGTSSSRIPGAASSRRVKFAANVQIGRGTRLTQ
jgi:hypothetical protein